MHSNRIKEKVKRDYNAIAADFSQTRNFPWREFDVFTKFYRNDSNVLDLGCGNGRLLIFLKKYGYKSYLGLDMSGELLKHAKKNYSGEKFIEGDLSDLSGIKGKFDCIFLIASFHHIPPTQQEKTLRKIKLLLNKGGMIFMTNWNLHQPRFFLILLISFFNLKYGFRGVLVPWQNKIKRYYYAFTKGRLHLLFKKSGLKLLVNDYYDGNKKSNFLSGKNIISIAKNV